MTNNEMWKPTQARFWKDPWQVATLVSIVTVSVFAFVIAAATLRTLIDEPVILIAAIVVVAALQSFATINAVSVFQSISRIDAAIAFCVWLPLSAILVIANWGTWFEWLGARAYTERVFHEGLDKSVEWSTLFSARYQQLAGDAGGLARRSAELALAEEQNGGTCGDGLPPDKGPRLKLRTDDAALFGVVGQYFGNHAQQARETAEALSSADRAYNPDNFATSSQNIYALYNKQKALADDPAVQQLKGRLNDRIRADVEGWRIQGQSFHCADTKLRVLAQRLLTSLDLPASIERPILAEPNAQNAVRMAYHETLAKFLVGDVAATPSSLVQERQAELRTGQASSGLREIKSAPLPWILAVLPQLMILLASWRVVARNRVANVQDGPRSTAFQRLLCCRSWSDDKTVREFNVSIEGHEYNTQRIFEVLLPWVSLTPRLIGGKTKGAFADLFVPNAVQEPAVKHAVALVAILEAIKAATLLDPCVCVDAVPAPLRQRLLALGADTAGHYVLDRTFYEELVLHTLDVPATVSPFKCETHLRTRPPLRTAGS